MTSLVVFQRLQETRLETGCGKYCIDSQISG